MKLGRDLSDGTNTNSPFSRPPCSASSFVHVHFSVSPIFRNSFESDEIKGKRIKNKKNREKRVMMPWQSARSVLEFDILGESNLTCSFLKFTSEKVVGIRIGKLFGGNRQVSPTKKNMRVGLERMQ